jgi:DNA repair exonuclease SbcCD ATPase subunit
MKLLRLKVSGFGPLRGEWAFSPVKVNVVVDDNERGKTSMLAAVAAALYGLEDDKRSHRVMTPLERWRPWAGGAYGVELDLDVLGRRYRILRDFERGTVAVFDGGGREVTAEFLEGKDEYPVGRRLLGVDAVEFEKCSFLRQGEMDGVVPGDEKARRASTLRARLENAADTHIGDTNASEALRVLEESLRRYEEPELDSTLSVDGAIERLKAKHGMLESQLHELDHQLVLAEIPLESLAQLAEEENGLKDQLRRLEAERHAGMAAEIRRQLEENERGREELRRLEQEAAELEAVAQMPANIETELRETVTRFEEGQRNLETFEARRREEWGAERQQIEAVLAERRAFDAFSEDDARRCDALAVDLRRVAVEDAHQRHQVFVLRDQLAAQGYDPERIQFLSGRFGAMPEEQQRLLRAQNDSSLQFQTEVAQLEQERTGATEALRALDAHRSARRVPGWFALALGLGAALAGAVTLALKAAPVLWGALLGAGALVALAGAAMLAIGGRAQAAERDDALRRLAEAQRRLNLLRTRRAENDAGLADMARLMGYRDAVDLMRHWNEYARLLDDSSPLLRAQEQLLQAESQRGAVLEEARGLLRLPPDAAPNPESLEKAAYEARLALNARKRLEQLDRNWELVERERRVDEAAVAGLRERAVRILQSAGLTYDPARPWAEHVEELAARAGGRSRWTMLVEELIPYARKRLLPDVEVEQRRQRIAMLEAGREHITSPRPPDEIEVEAKQCRARLEEAQHKRADLRLEVEEVWRRHTQQRPELEAQLARLARARARAAAFKESVEIARATIQKVATDTHRRWAEFLNTRVAELLASFGARVDQLRFGEDLDFSLQLEGGPLVSRGKAHLQLSAGARDQLYLAVRLAVSEYLSRGGEPLPLLLDDAFATSDDARLQAGMRTLVENLAGGHQVVLVTCHRGRYMDLKRLDPELYRERVNWLDVGASAPASA